VERARAIVCAAAVVIAAIPILAFGPKQDGLEWPDLARFGVRRPAAGDAPEVDRTDAYRGVAAWIDIYNRRPWRWPGHSIRRMSARGVRTLFLQTGNYSSRRPVHRPRAVARFIGAAHRHDMKVVAWYLPGFRRMERDTRRTLAAVRFRGPHGERFDSFALDIESPIVDSIARRNKRLLRLSHRLRREVGRSYPLGAIVPDRGSLYWPNFPYRRVGRRYDVFLPMAYFTFRAHGRERVNRYIRWNIRSIRREVSDPNVAIHVIGGIAGDTTKSEMRGFVSSVRAHGAVGASLYDFPITKGFEWRQLRRLRERVRAPRRGPSRPGLGDRRQPKREEGREFSRPRSETPRDALDTTLRLP
jgi:hypothetical protein